MRDEAVWKALADGTRRHLLDLLKGEPRTTGALCDACPALDRCTVMKHLDVLVAAGLVVSQKQGRNRVNHINPAPLHSIVERWVTGHTALLADSAFRLKRLVEDQTI
jgi:DNA-binding transcriptional ArsR family regulator